MLPRHCLITFMFMVNHELLLHKLQNSYRLSSAALGWFRSYLCDREQCVVLNGKSLSVFQSDQGCRRAVIEDLFGLFLFCNDASRYLSSTCLMYVLVIACMACFRRRQGYLSCDYFSVMPVFRTESMLLPKFTCIFLKAPSRKQFFYFQMTHAR